MKEHLISSALPEQKLHQIIDSLLTIPKHHKLIHPCQERTRYASILDWFVTSISSLKEKYLPSEELAKRQQ